MRYGTFTFQAAPSGAYIFDFHDSDNGETIENIILIKPAISIGEIVYEIYGWLEEEWGIREYVAVGGLEALNQETRPFFHVMVPYEKTEQCLNEVSEILQSLHPLE